MFKKFENFLVERAEVWGKMLLLAIFFSLVLWRAVFWIIPISPGKIFSLFITIGLIADFVTLVVKKPV